MTHPFTCHRKCCLWTVAFLFFVSLSLSGMGYTARCEYLYEIQEAECAKIKTETCKICTDFTAVCNVCSNCTITTACEPHDLAGYCGTLCKEAQEDVEDLNCPQKDENRTILGISTIMTGVMSVAWAWYIFKEFCENCMGIQDDVDLPGTHL